MHPFFYSFCRTSVVAGAVSLLLSGCAPRAILFPPAAEGNYHTQDCVENALRHGPDPALASDAAAAFSEACGQGEAAACSALGVMYETGAGMARDPRKALRLYRRACDADNLRGCANLAEARSRRPPSR